MVLRRMAECKLLLALIWPVAIGFSAGGQTPSPITGAPFTAYRTSDTTNADGTHTISKGVVARWSNGSTYVEMRGPEGKGAIVVKDLAQHTMMEVFLTRGMYTVSPDLPTTQPQARRPDSETSYFKQLPAVGSSDTQGRVTTTTVAVRSEAGLRVADLTEKVSDGRSFERSYVPALDINLLLRGHDPATGMMTEIRLDQVKLGEPDENLFLPPAGYARVTMIRGRVVSSER